MDRKLTIKNRWIKLYARKNNVTIPVATDRLFPKTIHDVYDDKCNDLRDSMLKYKVDNLEDLMLVMYAPLMKKYKLLTYTQLQKFLSDYENKRAMLEREKLESEMKKKFMNRNMDQNAVSYYVSEITNLGWKNIDKAASRQREKEITIMNKVAENTTVYLVEPMLNIMVPIESNGKKYTIKAPGGLVYKIVVIKIIKGAVYMGTQLLETKQKEIYVSTTQKSHEKFLEALHRLIK